MNKLTYTTDKIFFTHDSQNRVTWDIINNLTWIEQTDVSGHKYLNYKTISVELPISNITYIKIEETGEPVKYFMPLSVVFKNNTGQYQYTLAMDIQTTFILAKLENKTFLVNRATIKNIDSHQHIDNLIEDVPVEYGTIEEYRWRPPSEDSTVVTGKKYNFGKADTFISTNTRQDEDIILDIPVEWQAGANAYFVFKRNIFSSQWNTDSEAKWASNAWPENTYIFIPILTDGGLSHDYADKLTVPYSSIEHIYRQIVNRDEGKYLPDFVGIHFAPNFYTLARNTKMLDFYDAYSVRFGGTQYKHKMPFIGIPYEGIDLLGSVPQIPLAGLINPTGSPREDANTAWSLQQLQKHKIDYYGNTNNLLYWIPSFSEDTLSFRGRFIFNGTSQLIGLQKDLDIPQNMLSYLAELPSIRDEYLQTINQNKAQVNAGLRANDELSSFGQLRSGFGLAGSLAGLGFSLLKGGDMLTDILTGGAGGRAFMDIIQKGKEQQIYRKGVAAQWKDIKNSSSVKINTAEEASLSYLAKLKGRLIEETLYVNQPKSDSRSNIYNITYFFGELFPKKYTTEQLLAPLTTRDFIFFAVSKEWLTSMGNNILTEFSSITEIQQDIVEILTEGIRLWKTNE